MGLTLTDVDSDSWLMSLIKNMAISSYSNFGGYKDVGNFYVSRIWKCPDTDELYILSTNSQLIKLHVKKIQPDNFHQKRR